MCAMLDEDIQLWKQFSLCFVHNVISIYVYSDLDLWSQIFKFNRVYPFTMVNTSSKFAEDAQNS